MTRSTDLRKAHVWRVEFPARQASLNRLLDRFDALGRTRRMPLAIRHDLHLVLDEIVSNIVHATERRRLTRVCVELTLDRDAVTLEVVDDGKAFDPMAAKPPPQGPIIERPVGGLGVHLVKSLMDKVTYTRRRGRNHLLMTRFLGDKGRDRPSDPLCNPAR